VPFPDIDVDSIRGNVNGLKSWADYLFPNLDSAPEKIRTPIANADIEARMVASEPGDVVLEEGDRVYEKGDSFKSYHHQAQ